MNCRRVMIGGGNKHCGGGSRHLPQHDYDATSEFYYLLFSPTL